MKRNKVKGIIQLFLVIGFVAFSVLLSKFIGRPQESTATNNGMESTFYVEVLETKPEPYQIKFKTTGVIQAQSSIQIIPQVSGRVIYVHPDFYTAGEFESDEILFEIDPTDYQLEIQRLEADVARAKTVLAKEQVEGSASLAEWEQQNGEKPAPALVAREPQLQEAKANLKAAEANLANAKIRLERTRFRLPKDGRIKRSSVDVGQYIQAGVSYGEVYYNDSLEISSSFNDRELEWLYLSGTSEVEISANHLGKRNTYHGKLSRRAASLDTGTRFGTVYFEFEQEQSEWVPGVFVEITVLGPVMEEVSLIPESALQLDGRLWFVDEKQRLRSATPDIIHRTEGSIAVQNLNKAFLLVTSKLHGATEGALAKIIDGSANRSNNLVVGRKF